MSDGKDERSSLPLEAVPDDWLNVKPDNFIRGDTPAGIEQRCLVLCQSYIGGSWSNAKSTADLTVKRISGGVTNQLYHVHLNETVGRVSDAVYHEEPSDVAIKFYQKKHMKNYSQEDGERLNDMIVLTIMSETGLGPKVYGIFADGFIQGYYKHEQFRAKHQANPKLRQQIFTLLARINHLKVPIRKDSNLLFTELRNGILFGYENCRVDELAEELNLPFLKQYNVLAEYDQLMERISNLNIPDVFTHSDFRGGNLLVTEDQERILACDLEYCGYGSRCFDLAGVVTEWGKTEFAELLTFSLPDEAVWQMCTELYIEECDKVVPGYAKMEGNSLETHLQELRLMLLAVKMYFLSFFIKQTDTVIPSMPFDEKKNMQFVEFIFKGYIELKHELIEKGYISMKV